MDFFLCGAQQPHKGKLKNICWVFFEVDITLNVLALVVDPRYESKQLFNNIFESSFDVGKVVPSTCLSEGQTMVLEFVENKAIIRTKYISMNPLLILESNINFDGGNASDELGESTYEKLANWDKPGSYFCPSANKRMTIQILGQLDGIELHWR